MSRKDSQRSQDQLVLDVGAGTRKRGPVLRALEESVRFARAAGDLDRSHTALVACARASARAVDAAELTGDVWKVNSATREHRANLEALCLVPTGGGDGGDAIDRLLADLSRTS